MPTHNKFLFLAILFLFPFTFATSSTTTKSDVRCTESPDKRNPQVHGNIFLEFGKPEDGTYYAERTQDTCKDGNTLLQVVCNQGLPSDIQIDCRSLKKKCREGHCVP